MINRIIIFLTLQLAIYCSIFAEEKLEVGLTLPLTGLAAEYGEAFYNGLNLGLDEHPEIKANLELKVEDHQFDSKTTLSAVRKLASIDKIDLIYVWGFNPSDAVAPVSDQFSQPLLLASLNPVSLNRSNVLNLEGPLEDLIAPLSQNISASEFKEIGLVASQVGMLVDALEYVKSNLPSQIKIASDNQFLPEDTDFRSLVARLKNESVPAVALFLAPEQVRLFIEQARIINYHPQYFGWNTLNTETVKKLFLKIGNGPIFVDTFLEKNFSKRYLARFNKSSHLAEAAKGYFLASLFGYLIDLEDDSRSIMEKLQSMPAGISPAGEYKNLNTKTFGAYLGFKSVLYQVRNGDSFLLDK